MEDKGLEEIKNFQKTFHEQNKKRISFGLKCMYIVPAVFLVLMFISSAAGNSKIVFLVLWIVSLFVISIGMILVEYIDYKFQQKLNEVIGRVSEYSSITNAEEISARFDEMKELRKRYKSALRLDMINRKISLRHKAEDGKEDKDE